MSVVLQAKPIPIEWHPGLSIFASEPFLKSVGDECGWLGGFDPAGRVRCVLPYTIVRKPLLRMVRFRVETIPWNSPLSIVEETGFLNSAVNHFRERGADLIIPATTNTIFRTYPDGAVSAPYGSYVLDLTQSDEALWANLHGKHRNVVRNAMKRNVQVLSGVQYIEAAHTLICDTLRRSGLRFMDLAAFRHAAAALEHNLLVAVAEHGGVLQGCAVIPYSSYSAYYLYGGSIAEPLTGAMNLLQWRAMQLLRGLGVERYDFVGVRISPKRGSKQEGLKIFKERFGGCLVQGYIWKYSLRPLKYLLYCLGARIRSGGDIVDKEQHKLGEFQAPDAELRHSSAPIPAGPDVASPELRMGTRS